MPCVTPTATPPCASAGVGWPPSSGSAASEASRRGPLPPRWMAGWWAGGGVYIDPFDPQWGPELGYSFHPDAWGQGFATELAGACLEQADQVLGLPEVSAFAHPGNAASRRVLDKVGFVPVRAVPDMDRILYRRAGRPMMH